MTGHLTGDEHPDYCSCLKPDTCWGFGGWHLTERLSRFDRTTVVQIALEHCPAYLAGIRRRTDEIRRTNPLLEI